MAKSDRLLGRIEAYKVISKDTEEDFSTILPSLVSDVSTTTYWINAEIGIVKILQIDERFLGSTRVSKMETLATITSVNFAIPSGE